MQLLPNAKTYCRNGIDTCMCQPSGQSTTKRHSIPKDIP